MAFDLDDSELRATRILNGVEKEIEVGEYIRTKFGEILKIDGPRDMGYIEEGDPYFRQQIVKHSKNIIDLIERFDYVNGNLVFCKMYEDEKDIPTIIKCVGGPYFKEDIKSIVTKEKFEAMEYKVKE